MLGASLLPARFRSAGSQDGSVKPGYLNQRISPLLQTLSRRSCTHPIHIIVFVALLASTSYIGLLEGSLFESNEGIKDASRGIDMAVLVAGGRSLKVGQETGWKWQSDSRDHIEDTVRSSVTALDKLLTLKVYRTSGADHACFPKLAVQQLSPDSSIG